jgi:N-dimethylarginine dimethylaminohydrolase
MTAPRFLMCPPRHFAVSYAINPWMQPDDWSRAAGALAATARRQWQSLHDTLTGLGATIELVPPAPGVPDLVFTANAAVVLDRVALLARFRHGERQGEEPHFAAAFAALAQRGVIDDVRLLPPGLVLEGAGDCVHDATRDLFWMGFGPRSDAAACASVADTFGREIVALELADARFYHMDTALCPLPGGEILFVPQAFTAAGRDAIAARAGPQSLIAIGDGDAQALAANAVAVGHHLLMSACSEALRARLHERGYVVITTPLSAFLRSGGAAFCLTLRLDRVSSGTGAAAAPAAAVA